MKLNEAFSGIHNRLDSESKNEFLSKEMLFKGQQQNKKTQIIRNQQMEDYHMFRNKLPWELNQNAGQMFNGHNAQMTENKYRKPEYHQQFNLKPSYYDEKNYGSFDTHYQMPTPLDNNKFYQYHTNVNGQGMPHIYDIRMKESRDFKQKRSSRSEEEVERQNSSLMDHFFTPMNGLGFKHNQDPYNYPNGQ